MIEVKHILKEKNLKIEHFFDFIQQERRPSYYSSIGDGEYYISDINDFISVGDFYSKT